MNAKFKNYTQIMGSLDNDIESIKTELKWYKFKVKQMANRSAAEPN